MISLNSICRLLDYSPQAYHKCQKRVVQKQVKAYLKTTDEANTSQDLSMFIVREYRAAKADILAELMEMIIKYNPNLALIYYPENHFFKICIVSGSVALFQCYMEQAIEPHLENLSKEEYKEYYTNAVKSWSR